MGLFSSGSAKRAAAVQAAKLGEAETLLKDEGARLGEYYTPYRAAGQAAIAPQAALLGDTGSRIAALDPKIAALYQEREGLSPQVNELYSLSKQQDPVLQEILGGGQGFTTSPGYDFRMQEGLKALERSRAANGTLNRGATGKALIDYSQGVASSEYGNYMTSLYNQLGAINTQLGGRSTALEGGYNQINSGINILGQDFNQITQQQQLTQQYQALIDSGMNASDAAARLGIDVANNRAGLIAGQGDAIASGMTAKSNQLLGMGDSLLKLAGTAGGYLLGGPVGGALASKITGGSQPMLGQQYGVQSNTWANPDNTTMGSYDAGLPWKTGNVAQSAKLASSSSYGY